MLLVSLLSFVSSSPDDKGFERLVTWMRQQGGRVDDRIDVIVFDNGIRGMVALEDIEEGAELLLCPWKLVMGSTSFGDQMKGGDSMCAVVQEMAHEIRQGKNSLWYPYLDHIELPRLLSTWDQSALDELQGLSPYQDATRHLRWLSESCDASFEDSHDKTAVERALISFVSRASEVGMIPIYDLVNHHNGKRNAKLRLTKEGAQLIVVGGPIPKRQEIYQSYGIKTASTMYLNYGFVEEWPTCWNFKDSDSSDNFAFISFPDDVVAINPTADLIREVWHANMPLVAYQSLANGHMESLSSEDLLRFAQAAETHLARFPTTAREDEILLAEATRLGQQDRASAIEYRRAFKTSLETARNSCNMAASARDKEVEGSGYSEL
eukprot:scaffold1564_cov174-Amphora_coffeaeformis.AAC.15